MFPATSGLGPLSLAATDGITVVTLIFFPTEMFHFGKIL